MEVGAVPAPTLPRFFVARSALYQAIGEFIPLYPVYALLFADSGLSTAQITSLLIIWSVVPVVLEVPSGALADLIPRRALLTCAALIRGAGFGLWVLAPGYASFAVGFVLWGSSGALESGTYESYVYDCLRHSGAQAGYRRVISNGRSGGLLLNLAATVLAAPLLAESGFVPGGCGQRGCLRDPGGARGHAPGRPARPENAEPDPRGWPGRSPRSSSAAESRRARPRRRARQRDEAGDAGFLTMLRAGLGEAIRVRAVRHALVLAVLLPVFGVLDEYFGLLARDMHTSTDAVPLLVSSTVAAQAIGAFAARRCPPRWVAPAVVAAAVCVGGGALLRIPVGFVGVAIGYGLFEMTVVVVQTRLQDAITGPARATVTSVAGMLLDAATIAMLGGDRRRFGGVVRGGHRGGARRRDAPGCVVGHEVDPVNGARDGGSASSTRHAGATRRVASSGRYPHHSEGRLSRRGSSAGRRGSTRRPACRHRPP